MNKCIVITTLSNDLGIIKKIAITLLEKHLVAGCQISVVDSKYWWNNEINETKEYSLQVRTIEKLYNEIEEIIKDIHNYEVPEISYYEINVTKEIREWINNNVK